MSESPQSTLSAAPPSPREVGALRPDVTFHWVLFWICAGVLLAALLMRVGGEGHVLLPIVDVPLPGSCTFRQFSGVDCPGCGLTRCFVSLAHGNLQSAWHFNPVGILLFGVVLFQVPFRLMQIQRVRKGLPEVHLGWWGYQILVVVLAGLLVQWPIRLFINSG